MRSWRSSVVALFIFLFYPGKSMVMVVVVVELAHSPTKDAWDYNKKREQQLQVYDSLYIRNTQLYYILQPWLHERKWFTFLFFCLYRGVSSGFQTFWVSSGRDLMKWGDWFYHFMFDFTIKPNLRAGIISIGVFSRILQAKQEEPKNELMLGHFREQPQV